MKLSQKQANDLYSHGNNDGEGYQPPEERVSDARDALERDGWTVLLDPDNTSDVVLLESPDGELVAIGGDGMGDGAWAVSLVLGEP